MADLTTDQELATIVGIWEGVRSRIDPSSPDYCRKCDYDDHRCEMCGEPTPHGGATPAHQRACWRYEGE